MDEMVTQYLTQAFAFVYVIDTSNSGGVNKYRVGIEITLSFLKLLFFNNFHCNYRLQFSLLQRHKSYRQTDIS